MSFFKLCLSLCLRVCSLAEIKCYKSRIRIELECIRCLQLATLIMTFITKLTIFSPQLLYKVSATLLVGTFEGQKSLSVSHSIKVANRLLQVTSRPLLTQSRCVYPNPTSALAVSLKGKVAQCITHLQRVIKVIRGHLGLAITVLELTTNYW